MVTEAPRDHNSGDEQPCSACDRIRRTPGRSGEDAPVTDVLWITLGLLAVGMIVVVVGLFVEERALEPPRLYDDEALR